MIDLFQLKLTLHAGELCWMSNYAGIYPIALTTFDEHYEVDEHSQLALINYLLECGAHGIAIFGNASEGYTLSEAEKSRLMSLIIKEVRKRVPVFVSTGHTGTHVAVKLSKAAQAAGADGLMILPPYFLKPSAEDLFGYYKMISEAVSIPIWVGSAKSLICLAQFCFPRPHLKNRALS